MAPVEIDSSIQEEESAALLKGVPEVFQTRYERKSNRWRCLRWLSCLVTLMSLCLVVQLTLMPSSLLKHGDRQPRTGGFEFSSPFEKLVVVVDGSDVGDCQIVVDLGTSERSHVVFSVDSDRDDAQDGTIVEASLFNNTGTPTLTAHVWFPNIKKAKRLHADLRLTLPFSLDTVEVRGNAASLVWQSGNIQSSLSVVLEVGSVRTYTPLDTNIINIYTGVGSITSVAPITTSHLSLETDTGSITLASATVKGSADLTSTTGSINGQLHSYSALDASLETGTLNLVLYPGTADSSTKLKSKTGSTTTGSVKVSGADVHKTGPNSGWVGSKTGLAVLKGQTKSGSVDLAFF
ncbi:hypothetical protein BCR33DRAFT_720144 [Rhizoclosmatium globosum]|uniref:Adhesin domain-containing protein n=1 Tax=Rhizoclosmatium globosum TaxID=329046 RepID=A0A1Y2BX16_9FUNG|nr:hypothetical protein BCR33DRAFT_720144 [Rhizoclosmatium globosum]|eukprot:ORY39310.1 hypothetical protein BCR33DRAFT_720144 [Rhizoclosmatium globosum]